MMYISWTCDSSSAVCSELTNNPNDLDAISCFVSQHIYNIGDVNILRQSYSIDPDTSDLGREVPVPLCSVQPE
jgi:hypothetical protein